MKAEDIRRGEWYLLRIKARQVLVKAIGPDSAGPMGVNTWMVSDEHGITYKASVEDLSPRPQGT